MIRINLIATGRSSGGSSSGSGVQELVVLVLLALLGFVGVYFWWQAEEAKLQRAQVAVDKEKAAVKRLKRAQRQEKKLKEITKLLKKKLKVITKLNKLKRGPVLVLAELADKVPKQVWLTSIRQRRGNKLVIMGQADNNQYVAQFVERLESSQYFKTVELEYTQKVQGQILASKKQAPPRTKFSLTCKADFSS